ncbi:CinA family protein [Nocardia sp. NPDC003693]
MLAADITVAVTGVGGPDDQDGEPAGSVWPAVDSADRHSARHKPFDGDPRGSPRPNGRGCARHGARSDRISILTGPTNPPAESRRSDLSGSARGLRPLEQRRTPRR